MKKKILKLYYTILAKFAKKYLKKHKALVIGINGSVGKTSCRVVIHQTLQQFLPEQKIYTSTKNFNGELGLPLSVFQIEKREPQIWYFIKTFFQILFQTLFGKKLYDIIILEYGIDTQGEMDFLLSIAKPDIGVLTALDAVHSEQFGDPGAIAKEEIKMPLNTKEIVFLNNDEPYSQKLKNMISIDKFFYQTQGYNNKTDISFQNEKFIYKNDEVKVYFDLKIKSKNYKINTNLISKFNYGYIGVALCIADILAYRESGSMENLSFGVQYQNGVRTKNPSNKSHMKRDPSLHSGGHPSFSESTLNLQYNLLPGRLSIFQGINNSILIDSSYNSSPLSVRALIDTSYNIQQSLFPKSKLWLVLGDMRELGDLTESEHRKLASYTTIADRIFTVGDSMQEYFVDELPKVGYDPNFVQSFKSSKKLGNHLKQELKKEKSKIILMFKGSQNTIFLEETVKALLLNKDDEKKLTRQDTWWRNKKDSFFNIIK